MSVIEEDPDELRERAVRREVDPSEGESSAAPPKQLGMSDASLRAWIQRAEIDAGQ